MSKVHSDGIFKTKRRLRTREGLVSGLRFVVAAGESGGGDLWFDEGCY